MKSLALLAGAAASVFASAQILIADNFDSSAPGALAGSIAPTGSLAPQPWLFEGGPSVTANIVAGAGEAGTNGVLMTRANDTAVGFYFPDASGVGAPFIHKKVISSLSFQLPSLTASNGYFGLESFSTSFLNLGSIGIAADGRVIVLSTTTAAGYRIAVTSPTAALTVSAGTWNNFRSEILYTTVGATVTTETRYFLNGNAVQHLNASVVQDAVLLRSGAASSFQFSDSDLVTRSFGLGYTTSAASVFADNYRVDAVPEPATMTALALGAAALLRRRKA